MIGFGDDTATPTPRKSGEREYAPLPEGITSFGAAIVDDVLYVYGGHKGRPHHYYKSGQVNELWQLDLNSGASWEVVTKGPHLQGLALVAHGGKLYRVGGFAAHNDEDEQHDLRSVADFSRFDPQTKQWESLTPLPEPRSSHDAVVIGDSLYVVGGWQLSGAEENWHTTAWVADLAAEKIAWRQLPTPPFQRRAIALGHLGGKLYVIGGMQQEGGPTTRVDVFDPASSKWSPGPGLIDPKSDADADEGMEGFGSSACTVAGQLFVSTYGGNLQCLDGSAEKWRVTRQLKEDRFFHRMLLHNDHLLQVGGASMRAGKRLGIEVVELSPLGITAVR
jgi:hypothetical protein